MGPICRTRRTSWKSQCNPLIFVFSFLSFRLKPHGRLSRLMSFLSDFASVQTDECDCWLCHCSVVAMKCFQLGAGNQSVSSARFRSWCINNCSVLFNGLHNVVLSRLAGHHAVRLVAVDLSYGGITGRFQSALNCYTVRAIVR